MKKILIIIASESEAKHIAKVIQNEINSEVGIDSYGFSENELLTRNQVCEFLGITRQWTYTYQERGELTPITKGKRKYFKASEVVLLKEMSK